MNKDLILHNLKIKGFKTLTTVLKFASTMGNKFSRKND